MLPKIPARIGAASFPGGRCRIARVARLAAAWLLIATPAGCSTDGAANPPAQTAPGAPTALTAADGAAMQRALLDHIRAHPGTVDPAVERRIAGGEPFVDPDGNLRIGQWLLEFRDGEPALTRRERQGGAFVVTVARLRRGADGAWRVDRVWRERHAIRP